jgi:hypothetical protein
MINVKFNNSKDWNLKAEFILWLIQLELTMAQTTNNEDVVMI